MEEGKVDPMFDTLNDFMERPIKGRHVHAAQVYYTIM